MLRLASALARFITKDANSPVPSRPSSPGPRKLSLKSKPSWRTSSVHTDNRPQSFKCPFTDTNALKAATKKEIDAYTSSEEIAKISEGVELGACPLFNNHHRRSLAIKFEDERTAEDKQETGSNDEAEEISPKDSEPTSPCSSNTEHVRKNSILKQKPRKNSGTVALDVYKRRGSGVSMRPRLNSVTLMSADKLNAMKEKFGTQDKVMHFFGRCFVKFFSNYG